MANLCPLGLSLTVSTSYKLLGQLADGITTAIPRRKGYGIKDFYMIIINYFFGYFLLHGLGSVCSIRHIKLKPIITFNDIPVPATKKKAITLLHKVAIAKLFQGFWVISKPPSIKAWEWKDATSVIYFIKQSTVCLIHVQWLNQHKVPGKLDHPSGISWGKLQIDYRKIRLIFGVHLIKNDSTNLFILTSNAKNMSIS